MQVKFAFNLGRVWQYFQGRKFAIISAYLSQFRSQVNEKRARELKQAVRSMGYGFHEIEGIWKDPATGDVSLEYPLFIPDISYDDAVSLGRGDYVGGPPQDSIVWADDRGIYLVKTAEPTPRIDRTFTKLLANEPSKEERKKRHERAKPAIEKQKAGLPLTPEEQEAIELAEAWTSYSKVPRGSRPWAYGSVTWNMGEPPTKGAGGWLNPRAEASWRNSKQEHSIAFRYRADQVADKILMYRGALYQEIEYVPKTLPKQVVALLRRKFRSPTFSFEINIPQKNAQNWNIDPNNVLMSTGKYREEDLPTRFAWHPISGEFLLSSPVDMHADTIRHYGSHPFDEYVRGLVLRNQQVIATRPWIPSFDFDMLTGDPEEDRAQKYLVDMVSNESQDACKRVLTTVGGVPANWKWRFDVTNPDLQEMTGIFRW